MHLLTIFKIFFMAVFRNTLLTPTDGKDARNKILFMNAFRCTLQIRRNCMNCFIEMESSYYRKELDLGDGPSVSRLHPLLGRFIATLDAL
mgnify:CR=1 FL=1